jgi:hypothetical protein
MQPVMPVAIAGTGAGPNRQNLLQSSPADAGKPGTPLDRAQKLGIFAQLRTKTHKGPSRSVNGESVTIGAAHAKTSGFLHNYAQNAQSTKWEESETPASLSWDPPQQHIWKPGAARTPSENCAQQCTKTRRTTPAQKEKPADPSRGSAPCLRPRGARMRDRHIRLTRAHQPPAKRPLRPASSFFRDPKSAPKRRPPPQRVATDNRNRGDGFLPATCRMRREPVPPAEAAFRPRWRSGV